MTTPPLDEVDRALVRALLRDARTTNQALAEQVGIAPSTCLSRIRALRERGVIRGYHADVDPAAFGQTLQAMISVRIHDDARHRMDEFVAAVRRVPAVHNVYFVGGRHDYLLHVATSGTGSLRDLVAALNAQEIIAGTETSLIFEHIRGESPPARPQ